MKDAVDTLAEWIGAARRVVYLAGAGLSVASGVRAYRSGPAAVWDELVTAWGTRRRFMADPARWWSTFWLAAHEALLGAVVPNAGHRALARLCQRGPDDLLVTQNIDGLSRAAGHAEARLIEIHGRHDRFVCARESGCPEAATPIDHVDLSGVAAGIYPRCPGCDGPMRPLVLLFDEYYDGRSEYQAPRARRALAEADVVVFVGTSFSVGITELALSLMGGHAGWGRQGASINLEPPPTAALLDVRGRSEEILPRLAARLGV
ncbi:MAG: Sir2 family NAD-dependent protein deacetylase [Myxococcota bacterium]